VFVEKVEFERRVEGGERGVFDRKLGAEKGGEIRMKKY